MRHGFAPLEDTCPHGKTEGSLSKVVRVLVADETFEAFTVRKVMSGES